MIMEPNYEKKYIKYKTKYFELKIKMQSGGARRLRESDWMKLANERKLQLINMKNTKRKHG